MEKIKKTILQAVTTGLTQGNWNAALNIPNITSTSDIGYMWYVSVAGNTVLGDIDEWDVGDWAMKQEYGWGKVVIDLPTSSGKTVIVQDMSVIYHMMVNLTQDTLDVGFFDPYFEPIIPEPPIPPEPPAETYLYSDSNGDEFTDGDGGGFLW